MDKQPTQTSGATVAQTRRDAQIPGRLRDLLGQRIGQDIYLSTEEAAQLTGRPSREAFIKWARRHGIPLRRPSRRARALVVRKGDIDQALGV